jgi:pimeloyl-ACP methyl ester carboxylesterase
MGPPRVDSLPVPGATLHYEVQGTGPVLLIIPGMPADAGFYAAVVRRLADAYTVVSYDPRGISRSRLDGPPEDQRVEAHADDARRVLDAVGGGPAHVLTDSVSGLAGLHLAAVDPGRLGTLVAFEPPAIAVLPDRERWRAFLDELQATYRADGLGPALQRFGEGVGLTEGEYPEPDPEVQASLDRMGGSMDFWLEHVMRPSFMDYLPDVARLRSGPTRVVLTVGDLSQPGQLAYETTHALAERLGTSPVAVPGDHNAVTSRPEAFTGRLRELLGQG